MRRLNPRGVTLVELMIVVAILGILAALGSIAYGRYIRSAKVQKLEQYGLELASGQERYKARNNFYWAGAPFVGNEQAYANLMDFGHTVPTDITIVVEGWDGNGGTCNICAGASFDDSVAGYAVRVQQDLQPGGPVTTLVATHTTPNPVVLNEGE